MGEYAQITIVLNARCDGCLISISDPRDHPPHASRLEALTQGDAFIYLCHDVRIHHRETLLLSADNGSDSTRVNRPTGQET